MVFVDVDYGLCFRTILDQPGIASVADNIAYTTRDPAGPSFTFYVGGFNFTSLLHLSLLTFDTNKTRLNNGISTI